MSATQVAVHGGRGRRPASAAAANGAGRSLVRLVCFSGLALYGVLRWATLQTAAPGSRLAGLLALAIAVAAVGPWLDRRSRPLAVAGLAFSFLAMLAIAGIPISWLTHARVGVISQGIGQGLTALPNSVVPYDGIDHWLRLVILLGAGVLLLDGAVMIALAPQGIGDLRRASAALPLIALAVVPATLVRPELPYLQGMILFTLVAAFMWAERIVPRRGLGALGVVGAVGVAGMIIGPALEQHHPWINPRGIAGSLTPVHVDTFDWTQRYGPFSWPRDNRDVLDVQAPRPDYWKAENLDVFTGAGWTQGKGASQLPAPATTELRRFTHTIKVTIRDMNTNEVIGAGYSSAPSHVDQSVLHGVSAGTWAVNTALRPGDSYTISAYSPRPTARELRADHGAYPAAAGAGQLTIGLPNDGLHYGGPVEVQFPRFHLRGAVQNLLGPGGVSGRQLVARSAYARAYALATRLATGSATPYGYALAIERYLSPHNGFVYDEHPPVSPFPLETFLFSSKRGYCQQFAGSMALLLRMGGVPARVATGFTTGAYDAANHRYVVSDLDAHAWVEAWFPRYGWVRFDPTPGTAPARAGGGLLPALRGGKTKRAQPGSRRNSNAAGSGAPVAHHSSTGGVPLAALVVGLIGVAVAAALLLRALIRPASTTQQLVAELERALARAGRPLRSEVTLHALEHRFRASPEAAGYVRTLRLARFAGAPQLPGSSQRRALRGQLAAGLGLAGRLRSWWALPPRLRR